MGEAFMPLVQGRRDRHRSSVLKLLGCVALLGLPATGAVSLSAQDSANGRAASEAPIAPKQIEDLYNSGRFDEALRLSERRLAELRAAGNEIELIGALSSHGAILKALGRSGEADNFIQRAIDQGTRVAGGDAEGARMARYNYAMRFFRRDSFLAAIPLLEWEYEEGRARLGVHQFSKEQLYDASVVYPMVSLAKAYERSGQSGRALELMEGTLRQVGNSVPESRARTGYLETLFSLLDAQGRGGDLAGYELDGFIQTTVSIIGETDYQVYAQRDVQRRVYEASGDAEKAKEAAFKNPDYIERRFEELLEDGEAQAFAFIDEAIALRESSCQTYCSGAETFVPILEIKTRYLEDEGRLVEAVPELRLIIRAAKSSRMDNWVLRDAQDLLSKALVESGNPGEARAMELRASAPEPNPNLDGNIELTIARLLRDEGFGEEADGIVEKQIECVLPDGEGDIEYHTPCSSGYAAMSEYAVILERQGKEQEAAFYRLPFKVLNQWRANQDDEALASARELAEQAIKLWKPDDYRITLALKIYRGQQGEFLSIGSVDPFDIPKRWRLCGRWDEPLPPEPEGSSDDSFPPIMVMSSGSAPSEPERNYLPLGYGHVSAGDIGSNFYWSLTGGGFNFKEYAEQCIALGKPEDAVRFAEWALERAIEMDFPIHDQEEMWLVKATAEQRLQRFDDAEKSLLTVADAYFGGAYQPSGFLSKPWQSVERLIELYGFGGRAERLLALLTRMSESGKFGDDYDTSESSRPLREGLYLMYVGMQEFDRARDTLAGLNPWLIYDLEKAYGLEGREPDFQRATALKNHGERLVELHRAEGNLELALSVLDQMQADTDKFFKAYPPPADIDPFLGRFLLNAQIHAQRGAILAQLGKPAEALVELERSGLFQMNDMMFENIGKDLGEPLTQAKLAEMMASDEQGQRLLSSFRSGYATAAELAMQSGDAAKAITYFEKFRQFPASKQWSLYEQQSRWVGVSLAISRKEWREAGLADAKVLVEGLERQWELASRNSLDSSYLKDMLSLAPTYFGDVLTLRSQARDEGIAEVDEEEAFRHLQWSIMSVTDLSIAQSAAKSILAKADPQIVTLLDERDQISRTLYSKDNAKTDAYSGFGDEPSEPIFARNLQRLRDIDDELRKTYPDYFEITSSEPVDLKRARSSLGRDEALLMISPGRFATNMMLVTRKGLEWKTSSLTIEDVQSKVLTLRHFLGATTDKELDALDPDVLNAMFDRADEIDGGVLGYDRETAKELYEAFIAPFAQQLEGRDKLIISPGGPLSGLPFAALVSKVAPGRDDDPQSLRDTRYLIDDFAITQIPALRSFILLREQGGGRSRKNLRFMGFGNPSLEGEAIVRGARGTNGTTGTALSAQDVWRGAAVDLDTLRQMNRLPGTKQELEAMQAAFGAPANMVLLEDAATETSVKQANLSDVDVLAFATHGLMAGEVRGVAEPGLVFTPPDTATQMDDGYLTASEVALLRLNADWVIISACNTASADGSIGAPALSGLAKSFFHAGAKALLVSHWYIRDDVAAELTVRSINAQRDQSKLTRAQALRASMLSVRAETKADASNTWAHPNAWAPLTLISGD
jgi:CHAT domain-containing protein